MSIPRTLNELVDLLLVKAAAIPDTFEQALLVVVQLSYLQQFADVNKRTSRLGANIPLIKVNLCPLSFVGFPERAYVDNTMAVYDFNRVELLGTPSYGARTSARARSTEWPATPWVSPARFGHRGIYIVAEWC